MNKSKGQPVHFRVRLMVFVLVSVFFSSCTTRQDKGEERNDFEFPDDIRWIEGSWASPDRSYFEQWQAAGDSVFEGEGFTLEGSDTLFYENIRIVNSNGNCIYVVTIEDQNGGLPVPFSLAHADSATMVFENRKHDYPNRIEYLLLNDTMMKINVMGFDPVKEFTLIMVRQRTESEQ